MTTKEDLDRTFQSARMLDERQEEIVVTLTTNQYMSKLSNSTGIDYEQLKNVFDEELQRIEEERNRENTNALISQTVYDTSTNTILNQTVYGASSAHHITVGLSNTLNTDSLSSINSILTTSTTRIEPNSGIPPSTQGISHYSNMPIPEYPSGITTYPNHYIQVTSPGIMVSADPEDRTITMREARILVAEAVRAELKKKEIIILIASEELKSMNNRRVDFEL